MPKLDPKYKELRGRVFMVDPYDLEVDLEHNARRYTPQDITDLACSMVDQGQIHDVMVRRTDGGKLKVVAGNLRTMAARELSKPDPSGHKEVFLLRCYLMEYDDAAAFERSVAENWYRKDASIIDTAHNIRRLMDLAGGSQTDMAHLYQKTPGWVSETLSLLSMPAQFQKMVHDGQMSAKAAYKLVLSTTPEELSAFSQRTHKPGEEGGEPISLEEVGRFLREIRDSRSPFSEAVPSNAPGAGAPTEQNIRSANISSKSTEEHPPQEPKSIPLTRKEIARFWEEMATVDEPKQINLFARAVVKWMAGMKGYGERKMKSVLEDVKYSGRG